MNVQRVIVLPIAILLVVFLTFADFSTTLQLPEVSFSQGDDGITFHSRSFDYEPGYPQIPVEMYMILLPPDADLQTVQLSISGRMENHTLQTAIKPAPPLYSQTTEYQWPKDRSFTGGKADAVYNSDEYYPKNRVTVLTKGMLHCYKLVQVQVHLCQYNPIKGNMRTFKNESLRISASKDKQYAPPTYPVPATIQKMAQRMSCNYHEVASLYQQQVRFTKKSTYLIVVEKSIQESSKKLAEFVASKKERGYEVKMINESDWGGGVGNAGADKIRDWLKKNYQEMSIEYVLLIGDPMPKTGTLAMRQDGSGQPTDLFYKEMTGTWPNKEGLAELSLGRIPVYDEKGITALDKILARTIEYENKPASEITAWRNNALFAAKPFKVNLADGSELFEEIKKKFVDPGKWKCYRIYSNNHGNPDKTKCTETAVVAAWKANPYGLMEWHTHGSSKGASSIMSSGSTTKLHAKPAFVHMGSCLNAKVETKDNLTYSMLINQSIGGIGGTRVTWYENYVGDVENHSTIQGFAVMTARGLIRDSSGIGTALIEGVATSDKKRWGNILAFNLYGCPEAGIYSVKKSTALAPELVTVEDTNQKLRIIPTVVNNTSIITIQGYIPKGNFRIAVYNLKGKLITTIANDIEPTGRIHTFSWSGMDRKGRFLSKGYYLVTLTHPRAGTTLLAPLF